MKINPTVATQHLDEYLENRQKAVTPDDCDLCGHGTVENSPKLCDRCTYLEAVYDGDLALVHDALEYLAATTVVEQMREQHGWE